MILQKGLKYWKSKWENKQTFFKCFTLKHFDFGQIYYCSNIITQNL